MDFATKDSWAMEPPVKPSYSSNFIAAAKQNAKNSVYRFEVTYGLYVMDFWEKSMIYTILGFILFFSLSMVIIPLSFACFHLASYHFALEPKGFHSVLERSAQQELGEMFLGSAIEALNTTFNGSSHAIHL